jgi:hypothetical protein
MKKWAPSLFLMGLTVFGFAEYGSSSGQSYGYGQSYNQKQNGASSASLESLKGQDPEAYEFAKKLSPLHQAVFCQQFNKVQQQQAMALVDSSIRNSQAEISQISPDMAVEVVMQTARDHKSLQSSQGNTKQMQPYSSQPRSSYPSQSQSGRYSND